MLYFVLFYVVLLSWFPNFLMQCPRWYWCLVWYQSAVRLVRTFAMTLPNSLWFVKALYHVVELFLVFLEHGMKQNVTERNFSCFALGSYTNIFFLNRGKWKTVYSKVNSEAKLWSKNAFRSRDMTHMQLRPKDFVLVLCLDIPQAYTVFKDAGKANSSIATDKNWSHSNCFQFSPKFSNCNTFSVDFNSRHSRQESGSTP